MSRRVVIGILIFLIVGVLGGIAALVVYQLQPAETLVTPTPTLLPQGNNGSQQVEDPTADSDGDGLSNADEKIWGTGSSVPDSDGDGFTDGDEVKKNHNPTIASPNDKLPIGFKPQQNVSPLDPAAPNTQSFDSFFSDTLDLTGGSKNLTQEYARTVPDKDKSTATFSQFISNQPIVTMLPAVNESAIPKEQDSKLALAQYMNIAGDIDKITDKTRLMLAMKDLLNNQDASGFSVFTNTIKAYEEDTKRLSVPPQAMQFHKLILGYSRLLESTLTLISEYNTDQVKALVAIRQLDAIDRQYYPIIIAERNRLINLSK